MDRRYLSQGNSKDEEAVHADCARKSQGHVVEIGVLNGWTSRILAANTKKIVQGIDPLIPDSMNPDLIGNEELIRKVGEDHINYAFVKDYSYNIVKKWNASIGYLFIDGDHKYEAVKDDFESWFPYVLKGGFIAIHDSAVGRGGPIHWEGPSKLVDELLKDPRVEYISTTYCLTLFKKVSP